MIKTTKNTVKLTLTEPILGSTPMSKEVYSNFILSKLREELEKGKITKEEFEKREKEELETIKETEEKGWTTFHEDDKGILLYDTVIRGFLKNAGNVLKGQVKSKTDEPLKQMKSKIDQFVFVFPRKIYLKRDGKIIKQKDDVFERPLRAMTMQGPRVSLAKSDMILEGATIEFTLEIIDNPSFHDKEILELFEYGRFSGVGQYRNGSFGRFSFNVVR